MGLLDFLFGKKKTASSTNGEKNAVADDGRARVCFVFSKAEEPGDLSWASEVVARVFGPGHAAKIDKDTTVTVTHGEDTVGFLLHHPYPIPTDEVERFADHNILWPKGKAEAAGHRSHVSVATYAIAGKTPIQSTIELSRLALVALELFDGTGVYWGRAEVCNSREVFESHCEILCEERLPVSMWLRFQLVLRAEDDDIAMYTQGMQQFGQMEVEADFCKTPVQYLYLLVLGLATDLIRNGATLEDGHTVSECDQGRLVVRHRASMIEKERRVYTIVFDDK